MYRKFRKSSFTLSVARATIPSKTEAAGITNLGVGLYPIPHSLKPRRLGGVGVSAKPAQGHLIILKYRQYCAYTLSVPNWKVYRIGN